MNLTTKLEINIYPFNTYLLKKSNREIKITNKLGDNTEEELAVIFVK